MPEEIHSETPVENQSENNVNDGSTDVSKLTEEQLRDELGKVRREAAQRRIENRDLKTKADKWAEYEESQKTELEKLQAELAKRDNELSSFKLSAMKTSIAREVGLDADDAELLSGTDEVAIREQAEKLKARLAPKQGNSPVDLLAGKRGQPVGKDSEANIDAMIRASARRQNMFS